MGQNERQTLTGISADFWDDADSFDNFLKIGVNL
jgi:hypothetical protein